jgi:hypothetical protein
VEEVRNTDKPNGRRRPIRMLEDNTKMDPKEVGCNSLDCTQMV